ncbi:MAG: hypothetical protein IPN53_12565 [Comamonadaceae bacterium]|nr:hypothetical protein [Comamonadaceae bacterium]
MAKLTFGRIARIALAVSAVLGAQMVMADNSTNLAVGKSKSITDGKWERGGELWMERTRRIAAGGFEIQVRDTPRYIGLRPYYIDPDQMPPLPSHLTPRPTSPTFSNEKIG